MHSTETALLCIISDIYSEANVKQATMLVNLDLQHHLIYLAVINCSRSCRLSLMSVIQHCNSYSQICDADNSL